MTDEPARTSAWARATYHGKYRRFEDVESLPKPIQSPLPIYSGGNAEGSIRSAAARCDGWLPARIGPDAIEAGRAKLDAYARQAGRDPAAIVTALQTVVCLGDTTEQARARFSASSFDLFRSSLERTMMRGVSREAYLSANLIGTPDEVCEKVAAFARAGLQHFCATLFVGNTVDEVLDQMRTFARYVLPAFPERGRAA
jgi:alkanesulfonate monooxygenase SsuD/methylene tetrahydromethanopterin reductase-like flavin-dependent oxidoreductase (luciferase family)